MATGAPPGKRPSGGGGDGTASKRASTKQACNYGKKCYRRNPSHFSEFSHPHLEDLLRKQKDKELCVPAGYETELDDSTILDQLKVLKELQKDSKEYDRKPDKGSGSKNPVPSPPKRYRSASYGKVLAKLNAAAPFYFFLTTIYDSPQTHQEDLSISFPELLDPSLGDLQSSLQVNFMVDLGWLLEQYVKARHLDKPMLILYGDDDEDLKDPKNRPDNIEAIRVKPPHPFGHHHTKMSLLHYKDGGLRVVVHTANLIESDWHNRTQGLWMSPLCPQLPDDADTNAGESPTEFKADLLRYLCFYKLPKLQEWIGRVRRADFSKIRVWFVSSVPQSHKDSDMNKWGHRRLGNILKRHATQMDSKWTVISQCSSIGSLGPEPSSWLLGEFRNSLSEAAGQAICVPSPQLKVIYPSFQNVADSHDGLLGGGCLPYGKMTHNKQRWFRDYLYQWKSSRRYRSKAMPHIKTYARLSPDNTEVGWFHLTSANLSKAAWGMMNKNRTSLYIMSYEAGVLFLPKFVTESETFKVTGKKAEDRDCISLPYDVPVTQYEDKDNPWFSDIFSSIRFHEVSRHKLLQQPVGKQQPLCLQPLRGKLTLLKCHMVKGRCW